MKLATKKLFHNLLAIAVSVCMVCTLTPSVAWATSSSRSGNETTEIGAVEGEDTATGSTSIKGKVYDVNFDFVQITGGGNFPSKDSLKTVLESADGKIKAIFAKDDISNFTVDWGIQKLIPKDESEIEPGASDEDKWKVDESFNDKTADGKDLGYKSLASCAYENGRDTATGNSFALSNLDGKSLPTFEYPANDAELQKLLNSVDLNNNYQVVIVIADNNGTDSAQAHVALSLQPDYKVQTIYGTGETVSNSDQYAVKGNIYAGYEFPFGFYYPDLVVSSVSSGGTDPAYAALQEEASKSGEEIGDITSLALSYGTNSLPDGKTPYIEDLTVRIPLPADWPSETKTADVFGYSVISPATSPVAKKYNATVVQDEKTGALVAEFPIADTGATLGLFAIGTPMAGSYTVHLSATEGGLVSYPGNTTDTITGQPLGREAEFSALALITGYAFDHFEVRVGSSTAAPTNYSDGNLLKFNPASNNVTDGGHVYVHGVFRAVSKPAEGTSAPAYTVSGSLHSSDGATGSMTIAPAEQYSGAPASKTIQMGQSNVSLDSSVSDYAGLFIQFQPGDGCTIDSVKVNNRDLSFNYGVEAVMIGALDGNTNIDVTYRKLAAGEQKPSTAPVDVHAKLDTDDWAPGYIRAMLEIDGRPSQTEFEHTYDAVSGGMQTIRVYHTANYIVKATHIDANGVETDVTDRMVQGDRIDSLALYNVTSSVTVVFNYIPKAAEIEGTTGPGGSGTVVIDPTQQTSPNSKVNAASKARAAARDGSTITIDQPNGTTLENGHRARIMATPEPGYELGRVEVNGTNMTQYFKPHVVGNTITHWTMTVYRTETGEVPAGQGLWELKGYEGWGLYDDVEDNVVPIESAIASLTMTFNPKVPTSPTYQTITTHVEGTGGTITPSFKAEQNTTVSVQFFPDDTYKVDAYRIDNGAWVSVGDGANSLSCSVPVGTYNHDVYVRFTPGNTQNMPKSYTVTPQASAGGTISPSEPVKLYENSSFSFSILPKTGYVMASNPTLEGSGQIEVRGYTCTVSNLTSDCRLSVSFVKSDVNPDPTHVVSVTYNSEGGAVKPSAPFTVANGADASFAFLPKDGWYVKGVYVVDSTTPSANEGVEHGINLVGSVQDGRMFSLKDIQEDTVLDVRFAELSGPNDPNKPPELNDGDTFAVSPDNVQLGEGATISPSLGDMEFIKAKDDSGTVIKPEHAAAGSDITVIIASGYDLDDTAPNGGITIKNGDNDVTDKVTVKPAGDGLYEVTIPAENVTPDMQIVVDTKRDGATDGKVDVATVNVIASGEGTVSPSGIDGVVSVEAGKSQTFTFIPATGWKLHRVYVDDETINVTGNSYTIHNIQGEKTLQAVFVPLEEGEQQPNVVTHNVNVIADSDSSKGNVYPSGPTQVADGASLSVLVKPESGYKAVAYEGTTQTAGNEIPIVGNTIELSNIKADRTISVYFVDAQAADFLNLNVTYGSGGSVSPSGNMLVSRGATQTLSILPDAGKKVKDVKLTIGDGLEQSVKAVSTTGNKGIIYTTPAMTQKAKVYVEFCDISESGQQPGLPAGDDIRDSEGNTTYHNVTALVAGGGGVVMPTYARVANGAPVSFAIVPLDGYHVQNVTLNGSSVMRDLTNGNTCYPMSSVTADSTLRVVFEKDAGDASLDQYYTVFARSSGDGTRTSAGVKAGGRISPEGPVVVSGGGSQSFTILPDPNCKVSRIVISNTSANTKTTINDFNGSSYTLFGVDHDMNFQVLFTALKPGETGPTQVLTHSINASASLNGSISPAGTRTVDHGGDAMFSFIPWDGYKLSYIIVDGMNIRASYITNMQYTFPKVTEDHSIQAVFIDENKQPTDFVTVNVSSNRNGTVSPSGAVLVSKGSDLAIEATPFLRYKIKEIKVGGESLGEGADYTNGPISGTGYRWSHGTLTLSNVDGGIDGVEFVFGEDENYSPGPGGEDIPDYEKLGADVQPAGTGSTSIQPNPIYFEEPGDNAPEDQKKVDITIIPEDGKMVDKIVVNYGDGSKTVYEDDGVYEYDKDGNLVDSTGRPVTGGDGNPVKYPSLGSPHRPTSPTPTAQEVYEDGYITVDTDRGDVDLDMTFRDLTNDEKQQIENGTLVPATYVEVDVSHSSGGTVGPTGVIKVAKGSNFTLQMIPNANYEVASVTVDGRNRTSEIPDGTRIFILKNVQANQKVDVAFGFVKSETTETTYNFSASVVNSPADSGSISPSENKVREGGNQVVYFLPKDRFKISTVRVIRGGDTETFDGYNSPSMTVRNINADTRVEVEYVEAGPGEVPWTVKSTSLTVEVGAGKGDATPHYSEVPVGSSTEVSFYPEDEWRASYYTLNGKTTYLPYNVSSWPVMPDSSDGAENRMVVFFERIDSNGADQIVNVQLAKADGDSVAHGSASPSQASVAYGGSTTFYVYPEDGYTIDYVRFNGNDQLKQGVISTGASSKQNIRVTGGVVNKEGNPTQVTQTDADRLGASSNAYFNAYSVTLNDVVSSGTLEVKFKKIPNGTGVMVTTGIHKMTVTSVGGGMVSPLGEVMVPEGETLGILTTSFENYYLASVIRTAGNVTTDLTGSVEGRVAKARMGSSDCNVEVTFERVGVPGPPVYVSLGKTTYNGNDIPVEVGGYIDPKTGNLVPLQRDDEGYLCDTNGQRIGFTRGGAYEFYFNPQVTGENGRELVINTAKYDGKDLSTIPAANYLTNVVLNSSGAFDIEFRELNEGEQIINPGKGYTITIVAEGNGTVSPAGPLTRQPGGSTGPLALNGESENFAVSKITLEYADDFGNPETKDVPSEEYADGTYNLTGIDRDYTIRVLFEEYSIVRVEWDNSLGFVTPNHAPGAYIYRPVGTDSMPFLVAPYVDNELVQVVTGETSDSVAPIQYSDDERFADDLNAELGLGSQNEGISTLSVADAPNTVVQPESTSFAKVYGFTAPLGNRSTYVRADFRSTKEDVTHFVTTSVKNAPNGHGTIEPDGRSEVNHGATFTVRAYPEAGYTLVGVTVDGQKVSAQNPFVLTNVTADHTVEFEFGLPQAGGSGSGADRLLRVASSLARTGDLTGPVVGLFLLIAAAGLMVTAVSYIRRSHRRRQRYQQ